MQKCIPKQKHENRVVIQHRNFRQTGFIPANYVKKKFDLEIYEYVILI